MIRLRLIHRLEVRLILLMVEHHYIQDQADLDDQAEADRQAIHHYIQDQADLDDQAEADRQATGKVNTTDGRTSLYTGPG